MIPFIELLQYLTNGFYIVCGTVYLQLERLVSGASLMSYLAQGKKNPHKVSKKHLLWYSSATQPTYLQCICNSSNLPFLIKHGKMRTESL